MNKDFRNRFAHQELSLYKDIKHFNKLPLISKMQLLDIKYYLPNDILNKVDRASMAHSIEVRCPLLDYRIVDLAFQIPVEKHIQGVSGKNLLKNSI